MWKPGSSKPRQGDRKDAKSSSRPKDPPLQKIVGSALPENENAVAKKPATLSQKTLAMKFMQRKKHTEAERKTALQERKKQDSWADAPEEEPQDESSIVCVRDVPDPSLPLIFGRRSFGGFNKGVEDEFRDVTRQLRYTESEEKELREEVSAEEMTARMTKYTGLGRGNSYGRNNSSSQRNRKRQRK